MAKQNTQLTQMQDPSCDPPPGITLGLYLAVRGLGILTALAHRKWLIARMTAIACLAGIVLSLLLPVQYTATTKIMPPQRAQSSAQMFLSQIAPTQACWLLQPEQKGCSRTPMTSISGF